MSRMFPFIFKETTRWSLALFGFTSFSGRELETLLLLKAEVDFAHTGFPFPKLQS